MGRASFRSGNSEERVAFGEQREIQEFWTSHSPLDSLTHIVPISTPDDSPCPK